MDLRQLEFLSRWRRSRPSPGRRRARDRGLDPGRRRDRVRRLYKGFSEGLQLVWWVAQGDFRSIRAALVPARPRPAAVVAHYDRYRHHHYLSVHTPVFQPTCDVFLRRFYHQLMASPLALWWVMATMECHRWMISRRQPWSVALVWTLLFLWPCRRPFARMTVLLPIRSTGRGLTFKADEPSGRRRRHSRTHLT
jgi:hypothetical protein